MSIQVKDANDVAKYIGTGSGDGSSGTPFISPTATAIGLQADTAATTDTGTFSLLALTKRLLQRHTTLLAQLPSALTGSGNLKVSLAESTIAVPVTDNAGSLTVDGTVAATQSGTWNVGTVTTLTNVVHVDDNSSSLTVDNSGTFAVQATVAAGATNIAKAQGIVSAPSDVGVPAMAIRKATPINTSGSDSDYEMLQMSAGRLWASATIDAAIPAGSNVIGGVTQSGTWNVGTVTTITNVVHVDDNSGSLTVDGTVAATQSGTWNVGTLTTLSTITNVVHVDDNSGSLTVDNGGTFAVQATIAAGATSIAKAEDVASVDADVGVPAMAVRKATPVNTSSTDGDYEMLQISVGRLWTSATIDAALPAGSNAIGTVGVTSLTDTNSAFTTGSKDSISTSAVQITSSSVVCSKGVLVKAESTNAGKVYVGPSTVTNGTTAATDGVELSAGESLLVPVDNCNKVYVIGSASSQKVFWMAT